MKRTTTLALVATAFLSLIGSCPATATEHHTTVENAIAGVETSTVVESAVNSAVETAGVVATAIQAADDTVQAGAAVSVKGPYSSRSRANAVASYLEDCGYCTCVHYCDGYYYVKYWR